jgi:hypothetical protein
MDTVYSSKVHIDKNGTLIRRTFKYPDQRPELKLENLDKIGLKDNEEYINDKLNEYKGVFDKKHAAIKTKNCYPAIARPNSMTLLAFLCHDYTRAMIKLD